MFDLGHNFISFFFVCSFPFLFYLYWGKIGLYSIYVELFVAIHTRPFTVSGSTVGFHRKSRSL